MEDGAEIDMDTGDSIDIVCVVAGSNPAATVKVVIEDKKGREVEDITGEFEVTNTVSLLLIVLLDEC